MDSECCRVGLFSATSRLNFYLATNKTCITPIIERLHYKRIPTPAASRKNMLQHVCVY